MDNESGYDVTDAFRGYSLKLGPNAFVKTSMVRIGI